LIIEPDISNVAGVGGGGGGVGFQVSPSLHAAIDKLIAIARLSRRVFFIVLNSYYFTSV
jgi:hypothetical protein